MTTTTKTTQTTRELKAKLMSLVTLSKTNPRAVEYIHTRLDRAVQEGDRLAAQQCRLALRHAEKAAGC